MQSAPHAVARVPLVLALIVVFTTLTFIVDDVDLATSNAHEATQASITSQDLSAQELGQKEQLYKKAIRRAVKLRAEYKLAKKDAVTKKLELDDYNKKRKLAQVVDVHKAAAYLEIKRSTTEENKAKAQEKSAELSSKTAKQQQKRAEDMQRKAAALSVKASNDRHAALQEVATAATLTSGKPNVPASNIADWGQTVPPHRSHPSTSGAAKAPDPRRDSWIRQLAGSRRTARDAASSAVAATAAAKEAASQAVTNPAQANVKYAQDKTSTARTLVHNSEKVANRAAKQYKKLAPLVAQGQPLQNRNAQSEATGKSIAEDVVSKIFKDLPN